MLQTTQFSTRDANAPPAVETGSRTLYKLSQQGTKICPNLQKESQNYCQSQNTPLPPQEERNGTERRILGELQLTKTETEKRKSTLDESACLFCFPPPDAVLE
jgi:hypothetical protein